MFYESSQVHTYKELTDATDHEHVVREFVLVTDLKDFYLIDFNLYYSLWNGIQTLQKFVFHK